MKLKIFILILTIFLSFSFISSKAVCGEVFSEKGVSPSWFQVDVYSLENDSFNRSCLVSPDQFRYCCSIENSGWDLGDIFEAKIVDNSSGYIARPVILEITNSPYDVFPLLELEKVIDFENPFVHFNISSSNLTFVKIKYLNESENFSFSNKFVTLENDSYSELLEASFGKNNFEASSFYEGKLFWENFNYFLLEDVNFSREIVCKGCKKNRIRRGEKVDVFLNYNFSSNVFGLKIYEVIPYEWEVLDSEGEVFYNGGEYKIISFLIEGNSFSSNYSFLAPNNSNEEVLFRNYVEEILIDEEIYKLYKLIPVVSSSSKRSLGFRNFKTFSKVDNNYPIISKNDSFQLAVYSENFTNEGALDLVKINFTDKFYNRSLEVFDAYEIYTNLGNNFGKLSFELGLDLKKLEEEGYEDFLVYGRNSKGNFIKLTGKVVGEGKNTKLSIDSSDFLKEVIVFGIKNELNLWDKIVQFYWNLFGFKTGII
jgi:hypothetical protein